MSKSRTKRHKLKRLEKRKRLKSFALNLNKYVPRSEIWFRSHFLPYKSIEDEYNVPFADYIPDVINKKYKYIIEIDGSIHETTKQMLKDKKKDRKFTSHNFTVIRVKAYDNKSLEDCLKKVCELKGPYFKPAKIYKPKALVETGSGPISCMVKGDNSRGCLLEIESGIEDETI